jgi:hypothetical protein
MRILFVSLWIALAGTSSAQSDAYAAIVKVLAQKVPGLSVEARLICVNIWSERESETREGNKSLDKTIDVFEHARLKGGKNGMIGVSVCSNNLSAVIGLHADGVVHLIPVAASDLNLALPFRSAVFDSDGKLVRQDLVAADWYPYILQLITR